MHTDDSRKLDRAQANRVADALLAPARGAQQARHDKVVGARSALATWRRTTGWSALLGMACGAIVGFLSGYDLSGAVRRGFVIGALFGCVLSLCLWHSVRDRG